MRALLTLLLHLLLAAAAAAATSSRGVVRSGLVNTNVIRTVDLRALPAVKEQVGVVVQNEHDSKAYKSYVVVVSAAKRDSLAHLSVRERKSGVELEVTKLGSEDDADGNGGAQLYQASFSHALQPGEKISLNVDYVFLNTVAPRPAAVGQAENQGWEWADDVLVQSVYSTKKQKTVVRTRGDIRDFTQIAAGGGATKDKKAVTFGPFTDGDARDEPGLGGMRAEVRFTDNAEQVEALTHRREYFVSHWADDLNVLEHYALRNRGPGIDGDFDKVKQTVSRFMKARDNFVKLLLVKVPAAARNLYVVDEIGNVSTSAVTGRHRPKGEQPFKVMQLKPRYPLAGGWNYTWWHGYSVPLGGYLKVDPTRRSRHMLRVPFIGAITASSAQSEMVPLTAFDSQNVAISNYELRITLPEGAADIDVRTPFDVDGVSMQPTSYYFDSTGRTVVVIEQRRVSPGTSNAHVLVTYSYSAGSLWQKPLVIASVLLVVFALASVLSRMRMGLSSTVPGPMARMGKKSSKTE
ncbi:dolichyl-diphosphooligosaccharide--protein glycosyltransferase subunit 1 [Coemansia biformis]|uniref:Dolichyl-diphosphooligosaccharide--protein glycosyltransferase subunit 1 n=1 Tax=Coemansia biformis TaxID=1286918 RepID=A0A9W8CYJ6_9FUNG|nr:dolichyl-diphosphooligosaccharide--protein glycosyltransferase subunit 1 [Coemansia biformis]